MKRILVVDDEPDVLQVLTKELQAAGYLVTAAVNAQESIAKAQEIIPQLIVMDVLLPDMTGAEAVKEMRAYSSLQNIPVIFLTAMVKPEEESGEPLKVMIDGHWYETVAKPYEKQDLLTKVQRLIGS